MLVNPALNGLYMAAGIESPGGHQGWMGGQTGETRSDDDWMSTALNLANSNELATSLGCKGASDLGCLQAIDLSTLYQSSLKSHFAPAMPIDGQYPLGQIARGVRPSGCSPFSHIGVASLQVGIRSHIICT